MKTIITNALKSRSIHKMCLKIVHFFLIYLVILILNHHASAADPFTPPNLVKPSFRSAKYNVKDYGAKGDNNTNDTPAINKAIDAANADGGGDVVFPKGIYSAASIHIKSNVRFVLDSEAVITGKLIEHSNSHSIFLIRHKFSWFSLISLFPNSSLGIYSTLQFVFFKNS